MAALIPLVVVAFLLDCDVERRKSDAELGLNPQQAAGRRLRRQLRPLPRALLYQGQEGTGTERCLQGNILAISGLPANDERVSDIIRLGRKEMPGYSQKLSQQELDELLVYLHTL